MNPLASMYGLIVMRGEFTKMSQQRALTWDGKIQRDAEGKIIKEPVAVFDEARYEKFTKTSLSTQTFFRCGIRLFD